MGEITALRTQIINYVKTREVYAGYRKAGYSKKYLAEHESDIIIHKANVERTLGLEEQDKGKIRVRERRGKIAPAGAQPRMRSAKRDLGHWHQQTKQEVSALPKISCFRISITNMLFANSSTPSP